MQQNEGEEGKSLSFCLFLYFFSFTAKPLLLSCPTILTKIEVFSFCERAIFNKSLPAFEFHKKSDSGKEGISSHINAIMYILYWPQSISCHQTHLYLCISKVKCWEKLLSARNMKQCIRLCHSPLWFCAVLLQHPTLNQEHSFSMSHTKPVTYFIRITVLKVSFKILRIKDWAEMIVFTRTS